MNHPNHRPWYNRSGLWLCSLIVASIGLVLIVAGCSDNGISPNINDSADDNVSFFDLPYNADGLAKRPDIVVSESFVAQKRLKAAEGGVIPLGPDENVEAFVVVENSIVEDTTITVIVTRFLTTDSEMPIVFDFGPDGLQFSRPAVLRLNLFELFGQKTTSAEFYWLNEETNEWKLEDTLVADALGYVYGPVEHFSFGGLKGGGTTPGTTTPSSDAAD